MDDQLRQRISVDPDVMVGKPVIGGTRIPVHLILEKLAFNPDIDDLLADYPTISRDDIRACLDYAAALVDAEYRRTKAPRPDTSE